jgi:hypothetical protein
VRRCSPPEQLDFSLSRISRAPFLTMCAHQRGMVETRLLVPRSGSVSAGKVPWAASQAGPGRVASSPTEPPGYLVHPGGLFWEVRKVRISANARRPSGLPLGRIWEKQLGLDDDLLAPPGLVLSFPMGPNSEAIGFPSLAMPPLAPNGSAPCPTPRRPCLDPPNWHRR